MKSFVLENFGIRCGVNLVNSDEEVPFKTAAAYGCSDVDIYVYRKNSVLPDEIKEKYRRPFFEAFDYGEKSAFCLADNSVPFDFLLGFEFNESIMAFQNSLDLVFFHAACVVKDGSAFLFAAPSGGGKSTIALLAERNGLEVLDDDSCVIRKDKGVYFVQSFPVDVLDPSAEKGYRVEKVFFLEKSDKNNLKSISRLTALMRSMSEANDLYPWQYPVSERMSARKRIFCFLDEMLKTVPFNVLEFSIDEGIFSCSGIFS
ncbi:MAG: hypothetical protein GF408_05805 [Candidatus Omnitrophica bacterium]|nr:hypothetical protein [Candidatus Omnitrophota bacterium]